MSDDTPHCTDCGAALVTEVIEGRNRRYCPGCNRVQYRNPKPCAGALIVDDDRILLVKRTEPPDVGSWSVPAGYLEYDEPPRDAATRELNEETGLAISSDSLELFDTVFVQHPRGQHVLVLLYVAPVEQTVGEPEAGDDAAAARFWTLPGLHESGESIELGYEAIFARAIDAVR